MLKKLKLSWGLIIALFVLVVVIVAIVFSVNKKNEVLKQELQTRKASDLDQYVSTDPNFVSEKKLKEFGLKNQEVQAPVPTKIELNKITMVPNLMEGGDVIYSVIGELPDKSFFQIETDKLNKIFTVNSAEEATKYIDFLMITAGRSSYDRARKTLWKPEEYDKIGCKDVVKNEALPLPKDRPVSQAKVSGDGFEVTWIFFTPTFPAGYHKIVYQVGRDGAYSVKESTGEPFWPCGQGFVF